MNNDLALDRSLTQVRCAAPLAKWYHRSVDIPTAIFNQLCAQRQFTAFNPSLKEIPDPALLKGCLEGAELICNCIFKNLRLVIFGDYDIDGVSSCALLARFFDQIGFDNFAVFIPDRFKHGYGINHLSHTEVLALKPQCILTVDNGISAKDEAEFYHQHGITVIITDHHQPDEDKIPHCTVINPKQKDCPYPDKNLAGVGVAYLLLIKLRALLRAKGYFLQAKAEPNLKRYLDLVSLGTVGDQMPLAGVNRTLVYFGLQQLNHGLENSSEYGYYYLQAFRSLLNGRPVDGEAISFRIAPLINAAGRMRHASLAFELLHSKDEQTAKGLVAKLNKLNKERKAMQKTMFEDSCKIIATENSVGPIVVYKEDFNEGITGILAAMLLGKYHCPVMVFAKSHGDQLKGSGRSNSSISILGLLAAASQYLVDYGGHDKAAGAIIKLDQLDNFRQAFQTSFQQQQGKITPAIVTADVEALPWMFDHKLYQKLQLLAPFGVENQQPLFLIRSLSLGSPVMAKENFTKWNLTNSTELIWFGAYDQKHQHGNCDIIGSLHRNQFYWKKGLQIIARTIIPQD